MRKLPLALSLHIYGQRIRECRNHAHYGARRQPSENALVILYRSDSAGAYPETFSPRRSGWQRLQARVLALVREIYTANDCG